MERDMHAMLTTQKGIQEKMIELEKIKDDLINLNNEYTKTCVLLMTNQSYCSGLQCELMDDIVQLMNPNIHSDKAPNHQQLKEDSNEIKDTEEKINTHRTQLYQTMLGIQSKQTEFNVGTCNLNKSTSEMLRKLMSHSHKHTAQLEHQKAQSLQAFLQKAASRDQKPNKANTFGSREENENHYLV